MAPTAMPKNKAKKRKLVKKVDKKLTKKVKIKTLAALPTKETNNEFENDASSPDSEPESESETIQKLLEPYTKDQLIEFLVDAAADDAALSDSIREAADRDVSHRKIFVHGLGWDTTRETLVSIFESFGDIEDCNVVTDRVTGKAKGYGFVVFKSRIGAMKALNEQKKRIGSRMAWCQLASVGPAAQSQSQDTAARKIYVSNVQADVDPDKLRVFFAKFGEIETGPIGFDMQTGKSRGFALFLYKTAEGARKVLEEPYKMFEGHQLHCQKAADGKNKAPVAPVIPTAVQPVQAPVLAAQNFALFGQNPGFNPMYSALFANPNAALFAAAHGGMATGFGGYGAPMASHGFNLGGNSSVLGAYGSGAPTLQGLQHSYPNLQNAQSSSARPNGVGGSFIGYPPYM
ncbi:UBP1-associated protein 2B-like [Cornus florida]|uniref:UBP1-associated protein 2B-like n=1 Tax=Cornus florida TaxID=4283 RepID=UPI00289CC081|nr:UBP1-associated protein 2B-like [Cornus florida]